MRELRARVYADLRAFFSARGVLEVDTPVLSAAASTDPQLEHFLTRSGESNYYLQTSPEFAMKRLLAADSGPIYQLCKCFRRAESGRRHNPEFTMLEWYRPGFAMQQLVDEVIALLRLWWPQRPLAQYRYRDLLMRYAGIDYDASSLGDLRACLRASAAGFSPLLLGGDRDDLCELILSAHIEPQLGVDGIDVVTHFPLSQSQLAETVADYGGSALRFEVYVAGLELANGYQELCDADELRRRFAHHNAQRQRLGKPPVVVDERLLAAMAEGLPQCSGVALGVDRLLMLIAGVEHIDDVLDFPWSRA